MNRSSQEGAGFASRMATEAGVFEAKLPAEAGATKPALVIRRAAAPRR
jgi:hypothetical protein